MNPIYEALGIRKFRRDTDLEPVLKIGYDHYKEVVGNPSFEKFQTFWKTYFYH
mgnify:CR=1 FL=1